MILLEDLSANVEEAATTSANQFGEKIFESI